MRVQTEMKSANKFFKFSQFVSNEAMGNVRIFYSDGAKLSHFKPKSFF